MTFSIISKVYSSHLHLVPEPSITPQKQPRPHQQSPPPPPWPQCPRADFLSPWMCPFWAPHGVECGPWGLEGSSLPRAACPPPRGIHWHHRIFAVDLSLVPLADLGRAGGLQARGRGVLTPAPLPAVREPRVAGASSCTGRVISCPCTVLGGCWWCPLCPVPGAGASTRGRLAPWRRDPCTGRVMVRVCSWEG